MFFFYVNVFLSCLIVLVVISIFLNVIKFIGLMFVMLCMLILYKLCVVRNKFLLILGVMIRMLFSLYLLSVEIRVLVLGVLILNFFIIIKWF